MFHPPLSIRGDPAAATVGFNGSESGLAYVVNDPPVAVPPRSSHLLCETAVAYDDEERELSQEVSELGQVRAATFGLQDASSLHTLLKSLHLLGNQTRLEFIEALRTLHDYSLFYELGYGSYQQYCDRELGLARTTSFEYLRVAKALANLPCSRALFVDGKLSWLQVREITRVTTPRTEMAWIRFAADETVQDLLVEVKHALRENRDAPRDGHFGVPNLVTRLAFEVTLEEKERVLTALAIMGEALGTMESHPDAPPDGRNVLVRWADAVISGALPRKPVSKAKSGPDQQSRMDRTAPAQTVVYRQCPDCRSTTVATREGAVQVSADRVAELEPAANQVFISPEEELAAEPMPDGQIDAPNSARLARKVVHRDDLMCANPACGRRRNLHAHHITFRSDGGPTALENEVTLCDICHALIHKGLLEVRGTPATGLSWTRRPSAPDAETLDLHVIQTQLLALSRRRAPRRQSTMVDSSTTPASEALPESNQPDHGDDKKGSRARGGGRPAASTVAPTESVTDPPEGGGAHPGAGG